MQSFRTRARGSKTLDGIKAGVLMGMVSQPLQQPQKNQAEAYFVLFGDPDWKLAVRKRTEDQDWKGEEWAHSLYRVLVRITWDLPSCF